MKLWKFTLFILLISESLMAQNRSNDRGYINEFDCRIDSLKLNSTKASLNELRKYTYNKDGLISEITSYSLNPQQEATPVERTKFEYDANQIQSLILTEQYDTNTSSWIPTSKSEKTFDSKRRITSEANYQWNTGNQLWIGTGEKISIQYLSSQIEERTFETFDDNNNRWISARKTGIENNEDGSVSEIYFIPKDGTWTENTKCVTEKQTNIEYETFYEKRENWSPVFRRIFTENESIREKTETTECFQNGGWVAIYRQITTYNNQNETTRIEESHYDLNTEQWFLVKTETFDKSLIDEQPTITLNCTMGNVQTATLMSTTHNNGRIESRSTLHYEDTAEPVVISEAQTIYGNSTIENFSVAEGVISNENRYAWNWSLDEVKKTIQMTYRSPGNEYDICFFIGELNKVPTPTVPDESRFSLIAYPNPVIDMLTIEHRNNTQNNPGSFSLFDLNGKQIKQGAIEGTKTLLNLVNLSSGTYILNVQLGGKQPTSKVIIKK